MKQDTDTREVGSLVGFTFRDWWRVLRDNRFAVSRRYWRRWMPVTLLSLRNSRFKRKEDEQFGEEVEKAETKPPLFVLGHWRSGTTLLHSLLIQDERFTYPNLFQVTFPHIFLSMAEVVERQMAREEAERRAMDNVQVTYNSPGEDEFALAVLSLRSPTLAWMFPRREQHYDRYLTFQDVSAEEVAIWKASFIDFLKKLACCDARPPVLKSPPHTARIRLLLEMFPDARFVHISRHPHQVFRSTQKLFHTAVARALVQTPPDDGFDEGIIRRYRQMYEAYLAERSLIPEGRLHELRFEDLEQDMLGQVRAIYDHLELEDFQQVEPKLSQYIDSMSSYKKNLHDPLPDELKRHLAEAWGPMFDAFGYDPS